MVVQEAPEETLLLKEIPEVMDLMVHLREVVVVVPLLILLHQ
jgi:hypothetical protein